MLEHVIEGCQCEGKRCTRCEEVRCVGMFHRDNKKEAKLVAQCKIGVRTYHQAYSQRPETRERHKRVAQTYRQSAKGRETERAYKEREEVKVRQRVHVRNFRQRHGRERARIIERNHKLKRNYHLTPDDYQYLYERQMGRCAICGKPETRIEPQNGKTKSLAVDHCHATGLVRELLCNDCKSMLAFAHEDREVLLRAIAYLRKHSM